MTGIGECFMFLVIGPFFITIMLILDTDLRALGMAYNNLCQHLLGDMISPFLIGFIAD